MKLSLETERQHLERVSVERVIPIHVEGRTEPLQLDHQTQFHNPLQLEHESPRLDLGNAAYREYVWQGSDSSGGEGSNAKKERMKFGRRWKESSEKREGGNFTSTTSVDASTNVVLETSSRTVRRSKKSGSPREVEDVLGRSLEEAGKGPPRSNLDNTSYREFVWEGGDDGSGAAETCDLIQNLD